MKVVFGHKELEDLYTTSPEQLRGKQKYPLEVIKQYQKKVQLLVALPKLEEIKMFQSLNFEYLKGDRQGECSIRLNKQYRLIFVPTEEDKVQLLLINEISKHYE